MITADVSEYALRLGDDALIAAQRLAEWSARAPDMEEDIALSNIALDQLGVARALLSYAGQADGRSRGRSRVPARGRRLPQLSTGRAAKCRPQRRAGHAGRLRHDHGEVAVPLRIPVASLLRAGRLERRSPGRCGREGGQGVGVPPRSQFTMDHPAGDGTAQSHRRMQSAVDDLWPYTAELFATDRLLEHLAASGVAVVPDRDRWHVLVNDVLGKATLDVPADRWAPSGGRSGRHTEHLSYLLGELQVLHRAHPGASW